MEFTVVFEAQQDMRNMAVCLPWRQAGLRLVDEARKAVGVPGLPLDRVSASVEGLADNPEIVISEDLARRSHLFEDVNRVQVRVQPGSLNRFTIVQPVVDRDSTTGEVRQVRFRTKLDRKAVLIAWEAAGFPLEWGTDDNPNN